MLDFLFDNPFLLVILLFWLFSTIFGKKKGKVAEKPAPPAIQNNEPQPGSRKERRKNRQRDLMAKLEQEMGALVSDGSRTITVSRPAASAQAPVQASSSDPYAFHSASALESRPGPARSEELDYDLASADYDTPLESGSGGRSYEYRPAIDEPEAQEYHLTGFREFHAAQGLTQKDRTAMAPSGAGLRPDTRRERSPAVASLFAGPEDLRRAFILQEILGKPKGLRPPGR